MTNKMTERELQQKLQAPFKPEEIEWRIGRSGKAGNKFWAMCLAYTTSRAVQDRLDDVFGVCGWKDEYIFGDKEKGEGVICKLSVKSPVTGEWVTKIDTADYTGFEALKGGCSDSLKRAAIKFGIGRYLYKLEEGFGTVVEKGTKGAKFAKTKDGNFYWLPPKLPTWALPDTKQELNDKRKEVAILVHELLGESLCEKTFENIKIMKLNVCNKILTGEITHKQVIEKFKRKKDDLQEAIEIAESVKVEADV